MIILNGETNCPRGAKQKAMNAFFREHGDIIKFSKAEPILKSLGVVLTNADYHCARRIYRENVKENTVESNGHDVELRADQPARFELPDIIKTAVKMDPIVFNEFIKFGLAVEAVGGIDKAQFYLDTLKKLFK